MLHANHIGKVTREREGGALGKRKSGEVMMEKGNKTIGKKTDGELNPIGRSIFRNGVRRSRVRGHAKQMSLQTVGSTHRRHTASMFATGAVNRKLIFLNQ